MQTKWRLQDLYNLLILYILSSEAASYEQVQTAQHFCHERNVDVSFTMVKTVYWTTTTPCIIQQGGNPVQVVFLRFGVTTGTVEDRVRQWKNYCPFPLTIAGRIQSQDVINGQPPDEAIRSGLINAGFRLSIPNTFTDWFVLPEAQPNGVAIAALVQAAFTAMAVGGLTQANIGNVIGGMQTTMHT
ncbi:hypothetical protein J3E69DRAFT_359878 [Trichoderma sp. SZMC 28015]